MKKYLIAVFLIITSLQANDNNKLVKEMCNLTSILRGECPGEKLYKIAVEKGCKKLTTYESGVQRGDPIYFDDSDPYLNKNKCYLFSGFLIQRLDRTTGLFSLSGNTFLLTNLPNGRYIENEMYGGIVRGSGKYQYETIGGERKTISIGKVIAMP